MNITVTIPLAAAMNLEKLIQDRLNKLNDLQEKHPDLPMKDPQTIRDYHAALTAINNKINEAYASLKN